MTTAVATVFHGKWRAFHLSPTEVPRLIRSPKRDVSAAANFSPLIEIARVVASVDAVMWDLVDIGSFQ